MTKTLTRKAGRAVPEAGVKSRRRTIPTVATKRAEEVPAPSKSTKPLKGKLAIVIQLMSRPEGATATELQTATGWQPHSVRGAIAGAVKKAGHKVNSERTELGRRYRIEMEAAIDQA